MDITSTYPTGRARRWPGLWVPLVILIVGVASTAFTAHQESNRARQLAEARYQAEHQALVHLLLARAPSQVSDEASAQPAAQDWLQAVFNDALPPSLGVRVDTLARHTKRPLFQIRTQGPIDPTLALRTEVSSENFSWMLTTVPARALLEQASDTALRSVWLAGGCLTLVATALALVQCRRLHAKEKQIWGMELREAGFDQQVTNLEVEKTILRQALDDSEQRSRDLVALSGAIIGELDETGHIGFISPQLAELLERAPSDLGGQPFEKLIAANCRENFRRALNAARADHSIERIDVPLHHGDGESIVEVTLRILALTDPVHGLSGFRLSAVPHP
ncbi:PAS domain-containing protein [Marinobacter alexandrii]|jgi:PAS domain-containing protein|uniref:PAS domain-containing protein n=1 Tax=Marinobacter alexandrii TaxID=2570351 RepID=UPI002ABD27EC|nr:PAS domain-containing protein [Marinobacter alexandrii]